MRLVKFLAHAGVASRRKADELVASGRVTVAGEVITDPARDVDSCAEVAVDGRRVAAEEREYYLLNTPAGVVSTVSDPQGRRKVVDLVRSKGRIYPVGRLDAESTGLILLTNDGELANRLTHPRYMVPKTYLVELDGSASDAVLARLRDGIELEDGVTAPATVKVRRRARGATVLEITVREGRKRQVRRMCEAVGHPVAELERVRFGPLSLKGLEVGQSRPLTADEIEQLCQNQA